MVYESIKFEELSTTDEYIVIKGYANRAYTDEAKEIIDDQGTLFEPMSFDISDFKLNPVILVEHDRERPVGRADKIELRSDGLYIEAKIFKDVDPKVYSMVKTGTLSMFSVGAYIRDGYYSDLLDADIITKATLAEVSLVSIPSNKQSNIENIDMCSAGKCSVVRSGGDTHSKLQCNVEKDKQLIKQIVKTLLTK